MEANIRFEEIKVTNTDEIGTVKVLMLKGEKGEKGDSGDYATIDNKPSINNIQLVGNKTASDLGLATSGDMQGLQEAVTANTGDISTLQGDVSQNASDIADLQSIIENKDYEVVQNHAELLTSTADYVYVIHNDSICSDLRRRSNNQYSDDRMGDGSGCWFRTFTNNTGISPKFGGYLREDGTMVFAMPNQSALPDTYAPMSSIMNVFASYYNRPNLTYGRTNTLFNAAVDPSVSPEIDCSDMACALMYGVSYENSRYIAENTRNSLGEYCAMQFPTSRFSHLPYICELAEWFAEHKMLYTIPTDAENPLLASGIQAGDILFTSSQDTSSDWKDDYYSTSHIQLVVKTYPESGYVLVAHATSGEGLSNVAVLRDVLSNMSDYANRAVRMSIVDVNSNAGGYYQIFARPLYGRGTSTAENISGQVVVKSVTLSDETTGEEIGTIRPTKAMQSGKPYTLTVRGTLPQYDIDKGYIRIAVYASINGSSKWIDIRPAYQSIHNKSVCSLPFILPYDDAITRIYNVRVFVRLESGTSGGTYEATEISLLEGFDYDARGSKPLNFTQASGFTPEVTNNSYESNGHIYIDLSFANPQNTGNITIGTLSDTPYLQHDAVINGISANGTAICALVTNNGVVSWKNTDTTAGTIRIYGELFSC